MVTRLVLFAQALRHFLPRDAPRIPQARAMLEGFPCSKSCLRSDSVIYQVVSNWMFKFCGFALSFASCRVSTETEMRPFADAALQSQLFCTRIQQAVCLCVFVLGTFFGGGGF